MNDSRRFAFFVVTTMMVGVLPCFAQEQQSSQAQPAVTGTGNVNHIAEWKTSTTLGSSGIVATGGNVGIGTSAPAAKLEVNGDFSLSGSILSSSGGEPIFQALNNGRGNFSAGLSALPPSTTGGNNTALGDFSLQVNSSGFQNTAIGADTLGANTSGAYNTATGVEALASNITGADNTATGVNALWTNIDGSNNIAIGFQAGANISSTSNNIDIGNQGTGTDSGTIRIGTPFIGGCTACQTSAFIAGIYGQSTSLANVPVVIDSNGQLGTVSSSRRYKEDINDMADTSDGLMQLRPVTFRYKKAYEDGSTKPVQYGLIAEEVAQVYPDLVARNADGQVESVRYQLLDPMLLNELQKQHTTIAAQKKQIESLEERLARVEAILAAEKSGAAAR